MADHFTQIALKCFLGFVAIFFSLLALGPLMVIGAIYGPVVCISKIWHTVYTEEVNDMKGEK